MNEERFMRITFSAWRIGLFVLAAATILAALFCGCGGIYPVNGAAL